MFLFHVEPVEMLLIVLSVQMGDADRLLLLGLLSVEKVFIQESTVGVQNFSRPLRHRLLTAEQHTTLFQNIEKVGIEMCSYGSWDFLVFLRQDGTVW